MDVLELAKHEQQELMAQRQEIDAKLAKLNDFIALHAELSAKVVTAPQPSDGTIQRRALTVDLSALDENEIATKEDILRIAKEFLVGRWAASEVIANIVTSKGYRILAQHPVTRVSQILSASNEFITQRGKGWTLKQSASTPQPELVSASDLL